MIIIDEDIRRKESVLNENDLNELSTYLQVNYNNNSINRNINIEKEREFTIADISSDYILKNIFSFFNYENIIELVKYNKKLQNKLDIDINNYICGYEKRKISYGLPAHIDNGWGDALYALNYLGILIPHIVFFIIYCLVIIIPEIKLS